LLLLLLLLLPDARADDVASQMCDGFFFHATAAANAGNAAKQLRHFLPIWVFCPFG